MTATRTRAWNLRFVAYARANGRAPEAQLEHDRDAFPGGCMAGFMIWISAAWAEWERGRPTRQRRPWALYDPELVADFERFLVAKATAA